MNVFLGLGLPWVIATIYSLGFTADKGPLSGSDTVSWTADKQAKFEFRFGETAPAANAELKGYYVPAGSLGFSVVVFIIVAITCVIILLLRRKIVGGELGGSQTGRIVSCAFLCFLWLIYVIMSTLQAYDLGGLGDVKIGGADENKMSATVKYWLVQCDQTFDYSKDQGFSQFLSNY